MPDYQFSWFRDGSFIAYAMALCGENGSATGFHRWAARTILRYEPGARLAIADGRAGKMPRREDCLRARYRYDGSKGPDDWPEFQLDGLGTWLWALKAYSRSARLEPDMRRAAALVSEYLATLWVIPCHDLWEEFGERVHTYTLAAIYGGLQAAADLLQQDKLADVAGQIRDYCREQCRAEGGYFIKSVGLDLVDGSLTGLCSPYRLSEPGAPSMDTTIRHIEAVLHAVGRGVHRYIGDSYYGGGAWPLLSAWLGWYYAECGDLSSAKALQAEVEQQATDSGDLPEQVVPPMLADVAHYDRWVEIRGPIATPLLWSHAMYLILALKCNQ
jgi:GH15 family glucan-1,4-alpha-glucosidase